MFAGRCAVRLLGGHDTVGFCRGGGECCLAVIGSIVLTDVVDYIADERLQLCQVSVGDLGGEALNGTEIAVRVWPRKRRTGTYLEDRVVAVLDCAA